MYNLRRWHYTCVDLQAIVANGFTVPEDYNYNGVLYLEGFGFYANEDPQSEGFYLDEVSFSHSARNLNTTVYVTYTYPTASEPPNKSYYSNLQTAVQGYNWLVWYHHVLASIIHLRWLIASHIESICSMDTIYNTQRYIIPIYILQAYVPPARPNGLILENVTATNSSVAMGDGLVAMTINLEFNTLDCGYDFTLLSAEMTNSSGTGMFLEATCVMTSS